MKHKQKEYGLGLHKNEKLRDYEVLKIEVSQIEAKTLKFKLDERKTKKGC